MWDHLCGCRQGVAHTGMMVADRQVVFSYDFRFTVIHKTRSTGQTLFLVTGRRPRERNVSQTVTQCETLLLHPAVGFHFFFLQTWWIQHKVIHLKEFSITVILRRWVRQNDNWRNTLNASFISALANPATILRWLLCFCCFIFCIMVRDRKSKENGSECYVWLICEGRGAINLALIQMDSDF